MDDAAKTLEAIKELVAGEIQDDLIRELLKELRSGDYDGENRGWADAVAEWLIEYWGDPDA